MQYYVYSHSSSGRYSFEQEFDNIEHCLEYIKHELIYDPNYTSCDNGHPGNAFLWFEEPGTNENRLVSPEFYCLRDVNLYESGRNSK